MNTEENQKIHWKEALLPPETSVQDAIKNMEVTCFQIVLCINEKGVLLGTLTDGDIRRGLLKGLNMSAPIEQLIHKTSIVGPPSLTRKLILGLMQANKIHQLPIVDENRVVVGLHMWDELLTPVSRSNVMVIMAGGKGTRLLPHTENCPKPMLEVSGKPMLEHIINRAKSEGFKKFVISLHYKGHMIEEYFGNGDNLDVEISYIKEEEPLGTAGAISLLSPTPLEPFIVTNGDVLCDIRYGELLDFHNRHGAQATMAVRLHEWRHPFGVVRTKGVDIIGFEEKPVTRSHINAGVYVLDSSAIRNLEKGKQCDMPTLFTEIQNEKQRTIVYPMHEPWLDVGRPDDLARARENEDN